MQRLEFVDVAKGVGILFVTLAHLMIPIKFIHWEVNQMMLPMFWFISGYFFNQGNSFRCYLLKRSKQLMVPFLFFNLLVLGMFVAMKAVGMGCEEIYFSDIPKQYLFEHFTIDGPSWFLLALFWVCLIYYTLYLIKNRSVRWMLILILSYIGCWSGLQEPQIILPFFIDIALTALPFYALGHEMRGFNFLTRLLNRKVSLTIGISMLILLLALNCYYVFNIAWMRNMPCGNPIIAYIVSLVAMGSLLFLCRSIQRAPLLQFVGRHSLLLLCIQQPLYRFSLRIVNLLHVSETLQLWILSSLCLLLCFVVIYFTQCFHPKVTVQF